MKKYLLLLAGLLITVTLPIDSDAALRPATDADLAAMRAAGIPNPTVGTLWDPSDPYVGQAAGDAKQWLRRYSARHVPVQCFEPEFARRLQAFMSAVPGGIPTITDGYRDPSKQVGLVRSGASKAGPCQSYHNYGLGADFNNNSRRQTAWMRANARRFGIRTIGAWDPNHFQDARGRFGQCGKCSNYSGSGMASTPPSSAPQISGGPQPSYQSMPPAPVTYEPPIGEPLSLPDSPLNSFNEGTTSPEQIELDTPSALDSLLEIASEEERLTKTSTTSSSTPPRVTLDGRDTVTLSASTTSTTSTPTSTVQPFAPSQTFVTPDLADGTVERGEHSTLQKMQEALSALFVLLRPFGIRDRFYDIPDPSSEEYYLE